MPQPMSPNRHPGGSARRSIPNQESSVPCARSGADINAWVNRSASSGGTSGVSYLKRMLEVELFPELWHLRTTL